MLNSHPDKLLKTHVAEVRYAADLIWKSHSDTLQNQVDLHSVLERVIVFHDVGKATKCFQTYINNVLGYRGDKRSKAHTPFSMVAALGEAKTNAWSWMDTLAIAVSAAGHHSQFKSRDDLASYLIDGAWQQVLENQTSGIDWKELCDAVKFPLEPFVASVEFVDELNEWFSDCLLLDGLDALTIADGVAFRLRCQLVHSILLEADKAFLKIEEQARSDFRRRTSNPFELNTLALFISSKSVRRTSPLDVLRNSARESLANGMAKHKSKSILTMTLPTGSGKTLLAAHWALSQRDSLRSQNHTPPIVIVMPFLSVIEQTEKEYRSFIGNELTILPYHSLSVRDLSTTERAEDTQTFSKQKSPEAAEFMLDTWDADVIITTFDQFLLALLAPKTRYQMRFHSLCDAIVVMDEVQALPTKLWDIVHQSLTELSRIGNFRILAMSATQPGFLPHATEIIEAPESFYGSLARYELVLKHNDKLFLEDFIETLLKRANDWGERRTLIVCNTRKSARAVRDAFAKAGHEVIFLSADVTPEERLTSVDRIKEEAPCLVVATQCIEAGIDIDMDLVIRDFAPMDSIVQVAGRCNRHARRSVEQVEIVLLTNANGRPYCQFIYDKVLLKETRSVLDEHSKVIQSDVIPERDIFGLTNRYYERITTKKDLGQSVTEKFARWKELPDIHELLRGKKGLQHTFVVIEQDPGLELELAYVAEIEDRWERKRRLRALSSRLASISVSIYAQPDFVPERFAMLDPTGNFWLLKPGFYESQRGIDLEPSDRSEESEADWGMLL